MENINEKFRRWFLVLILLVAGVGFVFAWTFDISDESSTEFTAGDAPVCNLTGVVRWQYANNSFIDIIAEDKCYMINGITAFGAKNRNCCPAQYTCNQTTGKCMPNSQGVYECSDYKNKEECEGFNSENIADSIYKFFIASLENSGVPDDDIPNLNELSFCDVENGQAYVHRIGGVRKEIIAGCGCIWEKNNCSSYWDAVPWKDINNLFVDEYSCETTVSGVIDKCADEGYQELTWTAVLMKNGNSVSVEQVDWCRSGYKEFDCPSSASSLPFFSSMNFVLSAVCICLVYVFRRNFLRVN